MPSKPLNLGFKIELNESISGVLSKPKDIERHISIEDKDYSKFAQALIRLLKKKLTRIFQKIKLYRQLKAPLLIKSILTTYKQEVKRSKISSTLLNGGNYSNIYSHIPKLPIFNQRLRNIKFNAFLKLKEDFFGLKAHQNNSILQNRQNQLLNYLVPKLEEIMKVYAWRKISEQSKANNSRIKMVKQLQKTFRNIKQRVYYTDFLNKLKKFYSLKTSTSQNLACKKISKVLSVNNKFQKQYCFRSIQIFNQWNHLEQIIGQKKKRISKVYDLNTEKTTLLNKERQNLRNLKYKLDHDTVQKNHVLTERKRSLVLARSKFNQQSKQVSDQLLVLAADVSKYSSILSKQTLIESHLQRLRQLSRQSRRINFNMDNFVISLIRKLEDGISIQDGLEAVLALIEKHENRHPEAAGLGLTLETIGFTRELQGRKLTMLERIIRGYERHEPKSLSSSGVRMSPSLSQSALRGSSSSVSIRQSHSVLSKVKVESAQVQRLKDQSNLIEQVMELILYKGYELRSKDLFEQELHQLTELLDHESKQLI